MNDVVIQFDTIYEISEEERKSTGLECYYFIPNKKRTCVTGCKIIKRIDKAKYYYSPSERLYPFVFEKQLVQVTPEGLPKAVAHIRAAISQHIGELKEKRDRDYAILLLLSEMAMNNE